MTVCKRTFALLALAIVSTFPVRAEEAAPKSSAPGVRKAVIAVIEGQLAAFRAHDMDKAYAYASTPMHSRFTEDKFAQVVKEGYSEIFNNTRAEYGIVQDNGVHAYLRVKVHTSKGSAAFRYILLKEADGWHLSEVRRDDTEVGEGA